MSKRFILLILSLCWIRTLYAANAVSAPTPMIDAIRVDPNEVAVKEIVPVLFSARIFSDAQHIPKTVRLVRLQWSGDETPVSNMWDDGKHGDAKKKDGIYTCDIKLKEPVIGLLSFRIEVIYKGTRTPVRSQAIFVKIVGGN